MLTRPNYPTIEATSHEGPSDIRDTKIAALRLKFNAFKAVESEKDNDLDVEEDTRSNSEFLADLNVEFHDRALLANQKRNYNKPKFHTNSSSSQQHNQITDNSQKDYKGKYKALKAKLVLVTKKIDVVSKNKSEKGLVAKSYNWDKESLSFEDEGVTRVKAFMAIANDEPVMGKVDARSG
ncbi:hypothetical protein Tco_0582049 [Tanacetum coccineum]